MRALGIALLALGGIALSTGVFLVSFMPWAKVVQTNYLQIAGFVLMAAGYAAWSLTKPVKVRKRG